MERTRMLIVEDDETISSLLCRHFDSWGMESRRVEDFHHVMELFEDFKPHIILMDITLPGEGGFYLCRRIREISKAPVIFISSAADNMNILTAINMGGDDFIAKPFDLAILTAKVQALLRRAYDMSSPFDMMRAGSLTLDVGRAVAYVNGRGLELTKNEYRILSVLMEAGGRVVSRDTLMERLWATDSFVDENTLSVNINRLRRKLESAGARDVITTRKGLGYAIAAGDGGSEPC